jgi:CspA family cold shock protein
MPASGTTIGTVIRWDDASGTGLVEAPDLPGECWVDASVVAHSTGSGGLRPGQVVEVTWTEEETASGEPANGRLRAVRVRPREDLQTGIGG